MKPSFGFWPTLLATFMIVVCVQAVMTVAALWSMGGEQSPSLIADILIVFFLPTFALAGPLIFGNSSPFVLPFMWLFNVAVYTFIAMGIIHAVHYLRDYRKV